MLLFQNIILMLHISMEFCKYKPILQKKYNSVFVFDLIVKILQILGQGVFTTKHFQMGSFLLEYIRQTLSAVEGEERLTWPDVGSFLFFVNKNLWLFFGSPEFLNKFE